MLKNKLRRGRDSNPRNPFEAQHISSVLLSTAQPPLHIVFVCYRSEATERLSSRPPYHKTATIYNVLTMTFQAYIDNIKARTGKTPEGLLQAAKKAGVYSKDMKAAELVKFFAKEFGLGHGHSMAIWAVFKDKGWVSSPKK